MNHDSNGVWLAVAVACSLFCGCGSDDGATAGDAGAGDGGLVDGGARDAGSDLDGARPDAGMSSDAGADAGGSVPDGGFDAACPVPGRVDYTCTSDPASCMGGVCISALCLGPAADPERWASCSDGACGACESAASCAVDCGSTPARSGTIGYDPTTTITIKVHGLAVTTTGSLDDRTYGGVVAPGALEDTIRRYVPALPDGTVDDSLPNQLVAGEFYGTHPAPWLAAADIAEIDALDPHGPDALERYTRILAKFIRHRPVLSCATHAAIVCHSMGCHVVRYMIEHDVETLASTSRISRIVTVAGALEGAGLAQLFDNPVVRDYAVVAPIQTSDFVHLDPDFVTDRSAVWDHRLREANNPLWSGILMHSITGSDPVAGGATGLLRPLDVTNPDDEPNDSVLYARDTYFVSQAPAVRLLTPSGERLSPTHSWVHTNHPSIEGDLGAGALVVAGLYHRRKVVVRLRSVTLLDDHERDGPLDFGTYGDPPADLVPETTVRYDPFVPDTFGVTGAIVHRQTLGERSAPLFQMRQGETVDAGVVLFEGPVFDGMTSLDLEFDVREVDSYPHFGITELPSGDGSVLASFHGPVALADGTFDVETADLRATVEVHVVDAY